MPSDIGDIITLIVLLVLVAFSALFSGSETSLMTVNKLRVKLMAEEGNRRAITLQKVLAEQDRMLSAVLICNNLVNISTSSIATVLATKFFGDAGAGIATGVVTLLLLIFGEISPKNIAAIHSEKLALGVAGFIWVIMKVLTPVIFVINFLARCFIRLLGIDPDRKEVAYTEGELRTIMDVSHEEGVIEKEEKMMINNVFDFGDAKAEDVMIPRIDMTFVDVDATYDELLAIFKEDMFTRIPVYENTIDNVIGIINMKDLLLYDRSMPFSIRNYLREPFYTYESKHVSDLMMEMRESSVNITIVLDEYGATAGMITLEDLLEEIVGEIRDEYDEDEEDSIQKLSDTEYLIEANMKLDDINDALEIHLESEEYDSLGGLVIECLDHLPQEGEEAIYKSILLKVMKVQRNRIEQVKLVLMQGAAAEEGIDGKEE